MASTKRASVNEKQLEMLLDCVCQHANVRGRHDRQSMWETLAVRLSSIDGGCTMDAAQWKKLWKSWTRRVNHKASKISAYELGTGDRAPISTALSAMEQRLVQHLRGDAIHRTAGIPAFSEDSAEHLPAVASAVQLDQAKEVAEGHLLDGGGLPANVDTEWGDEVLKALAVVPSPRIVGADRKRSATCVYDLLESASDSGSDLESSAAPTPRREEESARSAAAAAPFAELENKKRKVLEETAATFATFLPFLQRWTAATELISESSAVIAAAASEIAAAASESAAAQREFLAAQTSDAAAKRTVAAAERRIEAAEKRVEAAERRIEAAERRVEAAERRSE